MPADILKEAMNAVDGKSIRQQILERGIEITTGDRNKSYGDPLQNLGLAGKIKELLYSNAQRKLGPAEREAIGLVVTKLSRIFSGSAPGRDTYLDGAVYFAIAGECAELESEGRKDSE